MPISAKRLPIARLCYEIVERSPDDPSRLWCDRCTSVVYDLSEMREREVRALLANEGDRRICVNHRTDARGMVVTRPEAPLLWIVGLTAALVGCASHLHVDDLEQPDDCDLPGACDDAMIDGYVAPDQPPQPGMSRPGARDVAVQTALHPETHGIWQNVLPSVPAAPRVPSTRRTVSKAEASDGINFRVDFSIDPTVESRRGGFLQTGPQYTPTRELIDGLREKLRENKRRHTTRRRRR
jgi:hypothetical protein